MADNDKNEKIEVGYYNQDEHFVMPNMIQSEDGLTTINNLYYDPADTNCAITLDSDPYTYTKSSSIIFNTYISTNDDRPRPKYIMPDSNGASGVTESKDLNYYHNNQQLHLVSTDMSNDMLLVRLNHRCRRTNSATYTHTLSLVNDSDKTLYYIGYVPTGNQLDSLGLSVKDSNGNDTTVTIDPLNSDDCEGGYYYRYLNGDLYRIYLSNDTAINPDSLMWKFITPYYDKQSSETDADYYARLKKRACYNMSMLELCNLMYDTTFNVLNFNESNVGNTYARVQYKTLAPHSAITLCTKETYDSSNMKLPYMFLCASYNRERFNNDDLNDFDYLTNDEYDSNKKLAQYAHAVTVNSDTQQIQYTNHRTWNTYTYTYNKTLYDYMVNAGTNKYSDMMIVYGRNVIFKED